jgi:hypothetical protein
MRRSDYSWEGGGYMRMPCLECGQNFSTRRCDAKYCSQNCRKQASRRKEKVELACSVALQQIELIQRTRRERSDLEWECYSALRKIAAALGVTAATVTDKVDLQET